MQRWLWIAAFVGGMLGAFQIMLAFFSNGFPEIAARGALGAALAVVPYVLARAREGFQHASRASRQEDALSRSDPSDEPPARPRVGLPS